jgi:hypothetical protein
MMRVLLVQTAQGLTPSSGGYKANVNLLRSLNNMGHAVAQICYGHEDEIAQYARNAEVQGIEPNVTKSVMGVVDANGRVHNLVVKTFTDEHNVHNIVLPRAGFNAAYPVREF